MYQLVFCFHIIFTLLKIFVSFCIMRKTIKMFITMTRIIAPYDFPNPAMNILQKIKGDGETSLTCTMLESWFKSIRRSVIAAWWRCSCNCSDIIRGSCTFNRSISASVLFVWSISSVMLLFCIKIRLFLWVDLLRNCVGRIFRWWVKSRSENKFDFKGILWAVYCWRGDWSMDVIHEVLFVVVCCCWWDVVIVVE